MYIHVYTYIERKYILYRDFIFQFDKCCCQKILKTKTTNSEMIPSLNYICLFPIFVIFFYILKLPHTKSKKKKVRNLAYFTQISMGPVLCNSLIARAPLPWPSTPSTSFHQPLAVTSHKKPPRPWHAESQWEASGWNPVAHCNAIQCFPKEKGAPYWPGHRVHLCEVVYILIINNSIIINNNSIIMMMTMMMMVIMTLFLLRFD